MAITQNPANNDQGPNKGINEDPIELVEKQDTEGQGTLFETNITGLVPTSTGTELPPTSEQPQTSSADYISPTPTNIDKKGLSTGAKIGAVGVGILALLSGTFFALKGAGSSETVKSPALTDEEVQPNSPTTEATTEQQPIELDIYTFEGFRRSLFDYDKLPVEAATSDNPDRLLAEINLLYAAVVTSPGDKKANEALDELVGKDADSQTIRGSLLQKREENKGRLQRGGILYAPMSQPGARVVSEQGDKEVLRATNVILVATQNKMQLPQIDTRVNEVVDYTIHADTSGQKILVSMDVK
jgi:hypothetical protein